MIRSASWFLGLVALVTATSTATGQEKPKSSDKSLGYWQFVESFRNDTVTDRGKARLYDFKWAPRRVTTRVGSLIGAGGNFVKDPVSERTTIWTWSTLPSVLVPGDRLPVTLAYTVGEVRGAGPPRTTMGAGFFKAATKATPNDKADWVDQSLAGFWGAGVKDAKGRGGLDDGIPEPNPVEGTVVVPRIGYAESDKTRMVDFAVVLLPGLSFRIAEIYRYKWVDGTPPPSDQRGGKVTSPGEVPPTDTSPPDTPKKPPDTPKTPPDTPTTDPADVKQMTIQAGSRMVKAGDTVIVPIWLIRGQGIANLNLNVTYKAAVAKTTGAFAKGNLLTQSMFETNTGESGVVRIGFAQNKDLAGPVTGTLAQITFTATGQPGDSTPLHVELTTVSSATGGKPTVATIDGEIRIVGPEGVIPGDSDRDNKLTARDAQNALKMSVKLIPVDMVCDMDKDGQVTSTDARLILQKVVGK